MAEWIEEVCDLNSPQGYGGPSNRDRVRDALKEAHAQGLVVKTRHKAKPDSMAWKFIVGTTSYDTCKAFIDAFCGAVRSPP